MFPLRDKRIIHGLYLIFFWYFLAREISQDIDLYTSREKERRKVLEKIQLVFYSSTFDNIYSDTLKLTLLKKLYSTESRSTSLCVIARIQA